MKASITFPVLVLVLLAGCSTHSTLINKPKSSYYEQVLSLLDPSNPVPLITVSTNIDWHPKQVDDVKVGMTVAEVVALWGKPRALSATNAKYGTFIYGNYQLRCRNDIVERIELQNTNAPSSQSVSCKTNHVPNSVASNYCERLHSLFKTNIFEQTPIFLPTNSVISIEKLKNEKIGTLKLGMTMSDIVGLLGKPGWFCCFKTNQAVLTYGGGTVFRGDCLASISVDTARFPQIQFDNGLTTTSSISSYVKALGTPLALNSEGNSHHLCYKFGATYAYFSFYSPDDKKNTGSEQDGVVLSSINIRYYGAKEMRDEADVKYIDTVATMLNLSPEKLKWLRKFDETDLPLLEKELGKPLTEEQRKGIASALEVRSKKYEEASQAYEF